MTDRSKVLIVDDDPDVRALVTLMLKTRGVEAIAAATGDEAASALADAADQIGVILLDLTIPDTTPTGLLSQVTSGSFPVPVIVMSGYTAGHQELPPSDRVVGYLEKPFQADALHALVLKAQGATMPSPVD